MSYLANSLDTAHKLHTLREKWAQVDSNSGPHLIISSPPLQICSQHKIRWQRTSFSFSSSSLGLSVLVLDFLWSTAGLLFSRARAWACCEISCWNMTPRSLAETWHWDRLLKHDTEIGCWNMTSEQGMNWWAKACCAISCWNATSEQGMNHELVSQSLLWDQLLKHNIRTGNEP